MRLPIFQIDAFTDRVFAGNPAAVCPLESWLDAPTLQGIATENNLSETAFFVRRSGPEPQEYDLRWFTPTQEVDLCGHATMASGWVVLQRLEPSAGSVTFHTRSGPLKVTRDGDLYYMRLPRWEPVPCEPPARLVEALGRRPAELLRSRDYLAVFDTDAEVRSLDPEMRGLASLDVVGAIVTAPGGSGADFVSRFFAPGAGVPEDPVTGSAHCTLTPYWARRLGKKRLRGLQLSRRGGEILCEDVDDAVIIAGRAVLFLEGTLNIDRQA